MARTLPIETLHRLLICDPEAGTLTWRERPREMFTRARLWKAWNTRYAGKPALNYVGPTGYRMGRINGVEFRAHRVVWAMATGEWPPQELDHESGVKTDNRLSKMRPATRSQNMQNTKLFSTSKSGVAGVCYMKQARKWRAYIVVNYKQRHLGCFSLKEEAIAARSAAETVHGFHRNHGRATEQHRRAKK